MKAEIRNSSSFILLSPFLIAVSLIISCSGGSHTKKAAVADVMEMQQAVCAFKQTYGCFPASNEEESMQSDMVTRVLCGKIPAAILADRRAIAFINVTRPHGENPHPDPWGSAYRFRFDFDGDGLIRLNGSTVQSSAVVWSIGENRIDEYGRGDDVASWKIQGRLP